MRILALTAIITACFLLVAVGFQAGSRTSEDASAGTTWEYQIFADHDGFDKFLSELPASCAVEFETLEMLDGVIYFLVIHACPD